MATSITKREVKLLSGNKNIFDAPDRFILKMSDIRAIKRGRKMFAVEPQMYERVRSLHKMDDEELSWFYGFKGGAVDGRKAVWAVTGSGADPWYKVTKGLIRWLDGKNKKHKRSRSLKRSRSRKRSRKRSRSRRRSMRDDLYSKKSKRIREKFKRRVAYAKLGLGLLSIPAVAWVLKIARNVR